MPFLTRYRRRWIAGFALAALTFAHTAIAAYGCLQGKMPEPQMACEEHQSTAPAELLCRVHFQAETQTLDLAKLPQLSAFNAPVRFPRESRLRAPRLRLSTSSTPASSFSRR